MKLSQFYATTLPCFGLYPDEHGSIKLWSGADAVIRQDDIPKKMYVPTDHNVKTIKSSQGLLYHAALEDVTRRHSSMMHYALNVASAYWSIAVSNAVLHTARVLSSKTDMDQLSPQELATLTQEYDMPEVSPSDYKHIERWGTHVLTNEALGSAYWILFRLVAPDKLADQPKKGLRACITTSTAYKDVCTAVEDDAGSIGDIPMSKRSIQKLKQIMDAMLATVLTAPAIVNKHTAAPAYECLWEATHAVFKAIGFFGKFGNIEVDLVDNFDINPFEDNRALMAAIATVSVSDGNRPLVRKKHHVALDMTFPSANSSRKESPQPQHPQQQPQHPQPQQPQPQQPQPQQPPQFAPMPQFPSQYGQQPQYQQPPQHPQPPPQRNDGYSQLPAWLTPAQNGQMRNPNMPTTFMGSPMDQRNVMLRTAQPVYGTTGQQNPNFGVVGQQTPNVYDV